MRVLAGFTTFHGMSVALEADGKGQVWRFDARGLEVLPLSQEASQVPTLLKPLAPLFLTEGHPLSLGEKLLLAGVGIASVVGGLFRHEPLWGAYFLLGYLSLGPLLRPLPIWGWHALEHKLVNLLEAGPLPKEEEALKRALLEASPLHRSCGTLFGLALALAFALLTPLLPLGLALPLGYLLAWGGWRTGTTSLLLPFQRLFLAPPRPWQVEAVVRGLARRPPSP